MLRDGKGLGEISPGEFKDFISENIRLEPVVYRGDESIKSILTYYMGKNTQERQDFIIGNLNYESTEDIAGFQFYHNGCVTGASGGDAEENGFTISSIIISV